MPPIAKLLGASSSCHQPISTSHHPPPPFSTSTVHTVPPTEPPSLSLSLRALDSNPVSVVKHKWPSVSEQPQTAICTLLFPLGLSFRSRRVYSSQGQRRDWGVLGRGKLVVAVGSPGETDYLRHAKVTIALSVADESLTVG